VRMIFERFVRVGSATTLARSLAAEGVLTRHPNKTRHWVVNRYFGVDRGGRLGPG
jgi:hypothetical protein